LVNSTSHAPKSLRKSARQQPLDPNEAARRGMRPALRRRFYEQVTVSEGEGGFGLALDGRPVRTPAGRALPRRPRRWRNVLADEWRAQREHIDPASMPLTRLANSIIDGVADAAPEVAAEVEKYLAPISFSTAPRLRRAGSEPGDGLGSADRLGV